MTYLSDRQQKPLLPTGGHKTLEYKWLVVLRSRLQAFYSVDKESLRNRPLCQASKRYGQILKKTELSNERATSLIGDH